MPRRLCRVLLVLALTPWAAGGPSEAARSPERAPQAEQTAAQGRPPDDPVYEDGEPVEVTHFDNEREPVSLGIALDTSGSMAGRKMEAARHALDRFLYDLLDPDDEFSSTGSTTHRCSCRTGPPVPIASAAPSAKSAPAAAPRSTTP